MSTEQTETATKTKKKAVKKAAPKKVAKKAAPKKAAAKKAAPKKTTKKAIVARAFADITEHKLYSGDITTFTDEEASGAWAALDLMEKISKDRKDQLRLHLFERLDEVGEENEKGSLEVLVDGTKVIKEKRISKLPDAALVEKLLKEAGLNISECFDEETKWVMNPSKVDFAVKGGKIPEAPLEASKKVTWALKVKTSGPLKDLIDGVKGKIIKKKS